MLFSEGHFFFQSHGREVYTDQYSMSVLLKILHHSTKPFDDLHYFGVQFPIAFSDLRNRL
jgi:hypothetical protein